MNATSIDLPGYVHVYSGKVRDLYAPRKADGTPDPHHLLLVASDRLSAFDFVLDSPIPDKGVVLTQLSLWWFDQLADLVPNHVVSTDVPAAVEGRAILVRRLEMLPVECVARAYLTGGGLSEYAHNGAVSGILCRLGLSTERACPRDIHPRPRLPGQRRTHPYGAVERLVGESRAAELRDLTVAILQGA